MRAELRRGIASDLEFSSQNSASDEGLLLRAEARMLQREATTDIARALSDARASAATVPPTDSIGQWAWSHALVHAVNGDQDGASTYLDRARTSGVNVGYLEGVLARAQSQWPAAQAAFDRGAEGSEQVEFSLIAAARMARAQGQQAQAQSRAQRVLQMSATHDGALSVLHSMGIAPPTPTPRNNQANGDAGASSTVSPAVTTPTNTPNTATAATGADGGLDGYASFVAEGQRWMRRGEYQKARTAYRQALTFRADGVEARTGEAWLNLRMGSYQAAYTAFRELYAANRREHEYRAGIGLTLEKLQRNDEAIREMRSYLGAAPWGPHSDEVRRRLAALGATPPAR